MTRRPSAPDSALTARVVATLLILGAYVVFRLPDLTSSWEAVATWIGAVLCGSIMISSIEELGLRRVYREQRIESIRDLVTETFPTPVRWPGQVEHDIADARHTAMAPIIDRGDIVEPKLFTHEYNPLTPPRGFATPVAEYDGETVVVNIEYTGRHRLADAQLSRERSWQVFGEL
jgi:hypothetical protein